MNFISIKNECNEFIYYFCNWWADNNKDTDLVEIILHDGPEINMYGRIKNCNLALGREYFPVATEGQLIKFIEDETKHKISISPSLEGKYYVGYDKYANNEDGDLKRLVYVDNALDGLWKVALQIAKEKV